MKRRLITVIVIALASVAIGVWQPHVHWTSPGIPTMKACILDLPVAKHATQAHIYTDVFDPRVIPHEAAATRSGEILKWHPWHEGGYDYTIQITKYDSNTFAVERAAAVQRFYHYPSQVTEIVGSTVIWVENIDTWPHRATPSDVRVAAEIARCVR